ncbi:DUF4870 domain-containing protein [Flavobacterium silvaticum]|uniref:DUF4870 domain-containing protein n=1 Tax=Flavobacterium silvaticum TaxID=1852020 RepID=A0A972JJM9_9FLAO|nr:DUF4870 domain-containing protein [Flavobacterium silvaticum]NMH28272.1 DUF4870 domain-containing protein [Flavobacterium silvaticum]
MTTTFPYKPFEHECEKASNSYLMSLVAIVAGLPMPIVNVIATFFYWVANRKSTFFVRWHCTQALISQIALMPFNSVLFWWTISLIMGEETISNEYFAYLFTLLLFNAVEFGSTIYCAVQTRKGKHVELWFVGGITNMICTK